MRSFVRCHGLLLPLSTPQITNKIEGEAAPSCCTGSIQTELEGRHASRVKVQHSAFGCMKDKQLPCFWCKFGSLLFFVVVVMVVFTLASPTYALIQPRTQIPPSCRKKKKTENDRAVCEESHPSRPWCAHRVPVSARLPQTRKLAGVTVLTKRETKRRKAGRKDGDKESR